MSTTTACIIKSYSLVHLSDDLFSNSGSRKVKLLFTVSQKDSNAAKAKVYLTVGSKVKKEEVILTGPVSQNTQYTLSNIDISSGANESNSDSPVDLEIKFLDSSDIIISNYTYSKPGALDFPKTPSPPSLASGRGSSVLSSPTVNDDVSLSLNYHDQAGLASGLKLSTLSFHYEVYNFKNSLYKTINISIGDSYSDSDNGKVRDIVILESQVTSFAFTIKTDFAKRSSDEFKVKAWVSYIGRTGVKIETFKEEFSLNTTYKPQFKTKKEKMHIIDKYTDRNDSYEKSIDQAPFSLLRKSARIRGSGVAYKVTR